MKISLRTKFSGSFFIVVVITGLTASWAELHLIGDLIVQYTGRNQISKCKKLNYVFCL